MPETQHVIIFRPAELHEGKEAYVSYYALNPVTNKLQRKKIKLNRISNPKERKRFANHIVDELNRKLYSGWNPFTEENAPKGFNYLIDIFGVFIRSKEKELRSDSMRSYRSFVKTFSEWLNKTDRAKMYAVNFKRSDAIEYMDYIYDVKGVSGTTWNNYRTFNKTLFTWMIERQYCTDNFFLKMRPKTKSEKTRDLIPEDVRMQIRDHLEAHDPQLMMICMMVFYLLIRPKEISYLKRENFSLVNQTVYLSGSFTKNKRDRIVTIPDALMGLLRKWNWNGAVEGKYIFGTDMIPGAVPVDVRRMDKRWNRMKKAMNLPVRMKLYSLRDSGIVQMLNDGISPEEVMKQADHSSLAITTIYAKFANPKGSAQIREKGSGF